MTCTTIEFEGLTVQVAVVRAVSIPMILGMNALLLVPADPWSSYCRRHHSAVGRVTRVNCRDPWPARLPWRYGCQATRAFVHPVWRSMRGSLNELMTVQPIA